MSQVQVCSYCYLVQRSWMVDHQELRPEDLRPYLAHLRSEHGVILEPQISE